MNDDLIILGRNIRKYRLLNGWSQEELASKCGYTSDNRKSTVQKIECGKSNLPASKIALFARAFGVDPADLFKSEDSEGYYTNAESAQIAQEIFENNGMRMLFDAARDVDPEDLAAVIEIVKRMKKQERRDIDDTGC